jgi:hypothetical protein
LTLVKNGKRGDAIGGFRRPGLRTRYLQADTGIGLTTPASIKGSTRCDRISAPVYPDEALVAASSGGSSHTSRVAFFVST